MINEEEEPMSERELWCERCNGPIQVGCVLGTFTTDESKAALRSIIVAAHNRLHDEEDAASEAVRRMNEIGPIA